jgi:hypothetical protein
MFGYQQRLGRRHIRGIRPLSGGSLRRLAPFTPQRVSVALAQRGRRHRFSAGGPVRPAVVREIRALDANLAPGGLITMREQVERTTASQRMRQLALRIALGAGTSDVMPVVLAKGLTLTAIGVAIGITCAYLTTRLMGYLLYGVSPRDPVTFGAVVAVVSAAALAACLVPARRATRTDPLQALRA